jgi:hypothetical protein
MTATRQIPTGAGRGGRIARYRQLVRQAADARGRLSSGAAGDLAGLVDDLGLAPSDFPADVSAITRDRLYEDRLVVTLQRELEARRRLHDAQHELAEIICERHEIEREQHAARNRHYRLWGRISPAPTDHPAE